MEGKGWDAGIDLLYKLAGKRTGRGASCSVERTYFTSMEQDKKMRREKLTYRSER